MFHYSLGKHTLVKGVSLFFIFLGIMRLCDNNEGLHFFGVSLTRHTFFKGVLKMKKLLAVVSCICLIFSLLSFNVVTVNAATEGNFTYVVSNGEATITGYSGNDSNVLIPSTLNNYTVTSIKDRAFYQNFKIESITIPSSVKNIGSYAFNNCAYLKNVTINNGVISIGEYAFGNCGRLETITIPPSLQKLANGVFKNCDISKVYITDLAAWCNIEFTGNISGYGPLSGGKGKLYLNNSLITKLVIPEGVTRIRTDAFNGCDSITSVVLPKSLLSIGYNSFKNCSNIKDVWYVESESSKSNVSIDSSNSYIANATWHYDSCPVGAPHSYDNDCDDTCNGCSKKRTVSGHSYDNTCDTTCNICNGIRTVSHTYDNSCDTQCNVCNSSRIISHTYGEWEVTKQASCTESGTKVRKCGVCSKTESDTISSLGHNFSTEWTTDKKATCITAGSKSKHCTRCSATSNDTTISASGHTWGEWVTEKKATDKTEGLSARKCSECGLKETQTIAKLAADGHTHKFGEWRIIKAATCKEKGNATRLCSVCKEQEQKDLLATGHQVGEWVEVSATCTSDGTRERICVICNETEKITIKALGHDFENPVVIKEPTDNEKGIKQGKCKRCGEETTEEIPALLSDNASNTDSNKKTDGAIGDNEDKNTNNNWVIWTIIGVLVLVGIGFGVYLILKKNRPNNQE